MKIFGKEHIDTAVSLNGIAMNHWARKDPEIALIFYEQASTIYEKELGDFNLENANFYFNLSICYGELKDPKEEVYLQKFLKAYEVDRGLLNSKLAETYVNVANRCSGRGNYKQAVIFHNLAINVYEVLNDVSNEKRLINYYKNLANLHSENYFFEESITCFVKIFETLKRNHGLKNERTIIAFSSMIENIILNGGDKTRCENLFAEYLPTFDVIYKKCSHEKEILFTCLSSFCFICGKDDEAIDYMVKVRYINSFSSGILNDRQEMISELINTLKEATSLSYDQRKKIIKRSGLFY